MYISLLGHCRALALADAGYACPIFIRLAVSARMYSRISTFGHDSMLSPGLTDGEAQISLLFSTAY